MQLRRLSAVAAVAGLLLVACSDDDDATVDSAPTADAGTAASDQTAGPDSIDVVAGNVGTQRPDLASQAAPDGTVTLIFSDIEDYTGMLERLGDLKSHLIVQDHNTIIRNQTALHNGREVEVRGDGVLLAFPDAEQAAATAMMLSRS